MCVFRGRFRREVFLYVCLRIDSAVKAKANKFDMDADVQPKAKKFDMDADVQPGTEFMQYIMNS